MLINQEIFVIWPRGSKQVIDRVRFTTSIKLAFALVAPDGKMEIRPAKVRNLEAESLFDGVFETEEDLSAIVGPPIPHNPELESVEKKRLEMMKMVEDTISFKDAIQRSEYPPLDKMIEELINQNGNLANNLSRINHLSEILIGYKKPLNLLGPGLDSKCTLESLDNVVRNFIELNAQMGELVELLYSRLTS